MTQVINVIFDSKVPFLSKLFIRQLAETMLTNENIEQYDLNIIFVDAAYIQQLNITYLNRDWETDVIAFPLGDYEDAIVEGEIYICTEKAKQQAKRYHVSYRNELLRLVIHGVLHLIGYDDLTDNDRKKMRKTEDQYLSQCSTIRK